MPITAPCNAPGIVGLCDETLLTLKHSKKIQSNLRTLNDGELVIFIISSIVLPTDLHII